MSLSTSTHHTSGSTDSFDISYWLAHAQCYSPLLETSFSFQSLPTVSSFDSIPQFPARSLAHKVHVDTYLTLSQQLLDQKGDSGSNHSPILLAAPTAPRLRYMMEEPLHIKKWLDGVPSSTVLAGCTHRCNPSIRKPESLMYNFQQFKGALEAKCHLNASPRSKIVCDERTGRRRSNRNALIFEREIRLATGRSDRISVKTPAAHMSVDRIEDSLYLKRSDTYFKDDTDMEGFDTVSTLDTRSIRPPGLMVSTSSAIFPISLESSNYLSNGTSKNLAARRGKKPLPPLQLEGMSDHEAYPSIPTAFLGETSIQMTSTENHHAESHYTDLNVMVSTLQSHRIFMPSLIGGHIDEDGKEPTSTAPILDRDSDSDEWAFADAFVTEYGNSSLGSSVKMDSTNEVLQAPDNSEDTHYDIPMATVPNFPTPDEKLPNPNQSKRPVLSGSPPQEVRGILKRCKSVRFASLPVKQRLELKSDQSGHLGRPVRYQAKSDPQDAVSRVVGFAKTTSGVGVTKARLANPFAPAQSQEQVLRQRADLAPNRPLSTPSCKAKSANTNASVPQRHSIKQQTTAASRNSAPPLRICTTTPNKENHKRSTVPSLAISRRPVDENVSRRDSGSGREKDSFMKKRMQAPLRNILTRFK